MPNKNEREKKAEELREIFMDVVDESTVTEEKKEERGDLRDRNEMKNAIQGIIEKQDIQSKLDTEELAEIVLLHNEEMSDTDIAEELGDTGLRNVVKRARINLHLIRDKDKNASFDLNQLREMIEDDTDIDEITDELGVSKSTVNRYRRVINAEEEKQKNDLEKEFIAILQDEELSRKLTKTTKDDGLSDATEGLEVNVDI